MSQANTDQAQPIRTDWIPGIHSLPILHGSMEMAKVALQAVSKIQPDVVLLEFPSNLEPLLQEGSSPASLSFRGGLSSPKR